MQRLGQYEEEKTLRKSTSRAISADDLQFRNQLIVDRKSGVGEIVPFTSRKKTADEQE